jgi:acyl dehydratase
MNPVHHDEPFALAAGFPAPLAVGMFTAGVMTTWATDWLGADNVRRTRMRWKKPLFPGAVLTVSGAVIREYVEDGDRKVDVELAVTDADGDVAVQGWMTFVVPA